MEEIKVQTRLTSPEHVRLWHAARAALAGGTPQAPIYPSDAETARQLIAAGARTVLGDESVPHPGVWEVGRVDS